MPRTLPRVPVVYAQGSLQDLGDSSTVIADGSQPSRKEEWFKVHLYFRHGIYECFIDTQRVSTIQQVLRKIWQVQLPAARSPY
jgi:hypothetical protein